jgi:hypothetical protein
VQKILTTVGFDPVCELHFRWDKDLIYIDIARDWYCWNEARSESELSPGRLCCGEVFNGILKEAIIKKGMLKKFAINEFAIRKIGHHYCGPGNTFLI